MFGGLGVFTFGYGKSASSLTNDPASCANCHVMQPQHDSWQKSAHRHMAVCNDCHLPHAFAAKWVTKAENGFFHSVAFTTGAFQEPIQIKARNRSVTQGACLACHGGLVNHMLPAESGGDMLLCIR